MWYQNYWYVIHSISNDNNSKKVKETIDGICSLLPCLKCRKHYLDYIKKNPIDEKNIKKWIKDYKESIDNVNVVTKKRCCGKPLFTLQKRNKMEKNHLKNYNHI